MLEDPRYLQGYLDGRADMLADLDPESRAIIVRVLSRPQPDDIDSPFVVSALAEMTRWRQHYIAGCRCPLRAIQRCAPHAGVDEPRVCAEHEHT